MKVAFILKGNLSDKAEIISEIRMHFSSEAAIICETEYQGHGIELAKNKSVEGYKHLVAVGGDGTFNEVINGVLTSNHGNEIAVGQLPYGTANDFAKTASFSKDTLNLRNHIFQNRSHSVDLGFAEFTGLDNRKTSRYFINISDIGIGGEVVQKVNNSKKRLGSDITFLKAIGETILSYKPGTVFVESKYFNWEGKIFTIAVANGKYFGSGICIAPKAKIDDGKLSLTIIGNITMTDYLLNINALKHGEHIVHPEVIYQEVEEVNIKPISEKCPLDIDGEFVGYAPVTMKIIKKGIKLIGTH